MLRELNFVEHDILYKVLYHESTPSSRKTQERGGQADVFHVLALGLHPTPKSEIARSPLAP